jgi:hypothetical protein
MIAHDEISAFSSVQGLGFGVLDFDVRIFGFWFLVFGFWFWVLDFGFWILGLGFWGFGVLGFGFWFLGFESKVRDLLCGVVKISDSVIEGLEFT